MKTNEFLPIIRILALPISLAVAVTVYIQHDQTRREREGAARWKAWVEEAERQTRADQQTTARQLEEKWATERLSKTLASKFPWNNPPPGALPSQPDQP